jgi:formamidopyrimidine-DNA glycosylase
LGRKIQHIDFYRNDLRDRIPKDELLNVLKGQSISHVFRRSKYILIQSRIGFAIIHLGMTGNLTYHTCGTPQRPHTHVVFKVKDATGKISYLHYTDPRRFGRMAFHLGPDWQNHPLLKTLGVEPLETSRLDDHLYHHTRLKSRKIKTIIMDNHTLVGVGNIYACEALFKASINPFKLADSLSRSQCARLASSIQETLKQAIAAGGTTIKDFRTTDGNPGYFAISLQVYGRANQPCLRCGHAITAQVLGGRNTFFCHFCQK